MKKPTKKERKEIYKKVLAMFKVNDWNFICHYLEDAAGREACETTYPEFFMFKEALTTAWLTYQIQGDASISTSKDDITKLKVIVIGLCIAMCD